MAVSSFLASTSVYFLNPVAAASKYFLAAGLAMISIYPYTLYAIMPTNYKLMDGDGNLNFAVSSSLRCTYALRLQLLVWPKNASVHLALNSHRF